MCLNMTELCKISCNFGHNKPQAGKHEFFLGLDE